MFAAALCLLSLGRLSVSAPAPAGSPRAPRRLRVEYLEAPITIDTPQPRFSYALLHSGRSATQASFRIVVTRSPAAEVVWDSGQVMSNRTLNIPYGWRLPGAPATPVTPLVSDADYSWSVKWTDGSGAASPAAAARFSTAILAVAGTGSSAGSPDWRGAGWVSSAVNGSLRRYRSEFVIAGRPVRGRLYVSGLGYAKTRLNGELTDAHELGQFVTFEERVLYDAVDVSGLLREGVNALGLDLSLGYFGSSGIDVGPPQFMLLLGVTTDNGATAYFHSTVDRTGSHSGGSTALTFTATAGPVDDAKFPYAEAYDGGLEAKLAGWSLPGYPNAAGPSWVPAISPAISPVTLGSRIVAHHQLITTDTDYSPVSITEPGPKGIFVADFAQNMAGQVTLRLAPGSCAPGTVINLFFTEILYPSGLAHNSFCERPLYWKCVVQQWANYTCSGSPQGEVYRVSSIYSGFRYVQVTGFPGTPAPTALTAHFIHTELPKSGSFASSSPLLNRIQHATRFAGMSNAVDIPTDCPQREKRGWLGDAQLALDTMVHNFDMGAFYHKWITDLADTQRWVSATLGADGAFPETSPFYGHGHVEADPSWGIAAWKVPMKVAAYFDDNAIERDWYPHARAYMEHWVTLATNNSGLLGILPIGDWGSLNPSGPNGSPSFRPPSLAQFQYVTALDAQTDLASRLGFSADATRYSGLSAAAREKYLASFYNPATACFGNCSDVEQIFGLALGLHADGTDAQRRVYANARAWFGPDGNQSGYRFGGGITSLKEVYPVLDKFGDSDLGLKFQLHTDAPPSFGYWIAQNSTTLNEFWGNNADTFNGGLNSYNHIMYGGTGSWYYSTLAGLQRAPGSRSWNDLIIAPPSGAILDDLSWANASIDTPMGVVSSAWSVLHSASAPGSRYTLRVELPPNAEARVAMPTLSALATSTIVESGRTVWSKGVFVPGAPGIRSAIAAVVARGKSIVVTFEVGSGAFNFVAGSTAVREQQTLLGRPCRNDTDCFDQQEWECVATTASGGMPCHINGRQNPNPPYTPWPASSCRCAGSSAKCAPSPPSPLPPGPPGPSGGLGYDCRGGRCIEVASGATANTTGTCEWKSGCVGLGANEWLADPGEWTLTPGPASTSPGAPPTAVIACKVHGTYLKKSERGSGSLPSSDKLAVAVGTRVVLNSTPKKANTYWIVSCSNGSVCGATPRLRSAPKQQYLMIGDSISEGYLPFVARALANASADIQLTHSSGNAGNANNIAHRLDCYLKQLPENEHGAEQPSPWDIITFNAGIHDLARGQEWLAPDAYSSFIYNITARLLLASSAAADGRPQKAARRKVFFVTTTPVPTNGSDNTAAACPEGILNADIVAYNTAAVDAVHRAASDQPQSGVVVGVIDLYAAVVKVCGAGYTSCPLLQRANNPHFVDPGWTLLGRVVADDVLND